MAAPRKGPLTSSLPRHLFDNQFSGTVPESINNLTQLKELYAVISGGDARYSLDSHDQGLA